MTRAGPMTRFFVSLLLALDPHDWDGVAPALAAEGCRVLDAVAARLRADAVFAQ